MSSGGSKLQGISPTDGATEERPVFDYQPPPQTVMPQYMMPMQQQQQQQQTTVVVVNQPQATNTIDGQPQNIRGWSTGICGCFEDCHSCCYAYCCYQCFLCSLATQMDECYCGPFCCEFGSFEYCTSFWGCNLTLPVIPNMFLVAMRSKLRAQYGIRGGICGDICCLWCCPFCATTQMWRELKHVGRR